MAIVGQFAWASRLTSDVPLGGWLRAERAAHQLCRAIVAIADGDAAVFWSSMPLEIRPRGALAKAIEDERQRRITWKRIEQSAELFEATLASTNHFLLPAGHQSRTYSRRRPDRGFLGTDLQGLGPTPF